MSSKTHNMQRSSEAGLRVNRNDNVQTSSFLTKLPAEIRNQIYQYIFTGKNIHIDCRFLQSAVVHASERLNLYVVNGKPWGISATVCTAPISDAEAYAQTLLPNRDDSSVAHYEDRHAQCLHPPRTAVNRNKLPMALLKTCKQVYNEALGYLYSDNTFSFKTAEDMDLFLSIALSPVQRLWIRSLYLHCETTRYRDPFACLTTGSTTQLENLRVFGLSIADYYKSWGAPTMPAVPRGRLEGVRVLVGPKPSHAKGSATEAHRNRKYAEEFERMLLEGDGE